MPKNAVQGASKRCPLNMRTTPDIRRRLEESARKSGRSLAQEIEWIVSLALSKGPGRPEGREPLLNLRVPQPLYDQLEALAELRGVTVSEEAVEQLIAKTPRSKAAKPLMLRLPLDVHDSLVAKAKSRGSSLNSLIIDLCKQ